MLAYNNNTFSDNLIYDNMKNELKTSKNFSIENFNDKKNNFDNNYGSDCVVNKKNSNFIASALLKNINSKNESSYKNKKSIYDKKFNISSNKDNISKTKKSNINFDENNKTKYVSLKIKEKELDERVLNESFYNNLLKENTNLITLKDKVEERDNDDITNLLDENYLNNLKSKIKIYLFHF